VIARRVRSASRRIIAGDDDGVGSLGQGDEVVVVRISDRLRRWAGGIPEVAVTP
jgi:hypothetical protein